MGVLEDLEVHIKDVKAEIKELRAEIAAQKATKGALKIEQVVERTGITDETLRKYCKDGTFPNAYRLGRFWFIPETDLLNIKKDNNAKA